MDWSFGLGGGGGDGGDKRKSWHWGGKNESFSHSFLGGGDDAPEPKTEDDEKEQEKSQWDHFVSALMTDSDQNKDGKNDAIAKMFQSWVAKDDKADAVGKQNGIQDLLALKDKYADEVTAVQQKYFGDVEISNLSPISLFYYLEREDEVKNPSWKCRKHRFHKSLQTEDVVELNTYFHYADIAYWSNEDDIKEDLANPKQGGEPYDLIHSKMDSEPNDPAFYVAVKRGTETEKDKCEILLAIRGTASIEDVITDVLCDNVEYKGGRAHNGILQSGKKIVERFHDFLESFVKEKNIQGTIDVLVVGHSLGGGAACIVGFELQDSKELNVKVVGFGTPGLVSKELGEKADFITTVVSDSDCVPRISGETMVNVVNDIMEHDWMEKAKMDTDLMINHFKEQHGWILTQSVCESATTRIHDLLDQQFKPAVKEKSTKRLEPVLFPPGACIHLWRDGSGISGSIVPGSFFDQIDITRTMLDDHLCQQGYGSIFLQLMRQYHTDPNFRFETLHRQLSEAV